MPKGPCDKRKRTKDPNVTDKNRNVTGIRKGCYPKGTTLKINLLQESLASK